MRNQDNGDDLKWFFVFKRFLAPQSTITQWIQIKTKVLKVWLCVRNFRATMILYFGWFRFSNFFKTPNKSFLVWVERKSYIFSWRSKNGKQGRRPLELVAQSGHHFLQLRFKSNTLGPNIRDEIENSDENFSHYKACEASLEKLFRNTFVNLFHGWLNDTPGIT